MELIEKIQRLEQQMRIREIADDGYYLSNQYKEDEARLSALRAQLPK